MKRKEREMLKKAVMKENEFLDIEYIKGTYLEALLKDSLEATQQILTNNPEDSDVE